MNRDTNNIIKACIEGDQKAQRLFFAQYNQKLFTTCMIYTNSSYRAEELLQESWIEIFSSLKRYSDQGSLLGWMKTIVIRKSWKMLKAQIQDTSLEYIDNQSIIHIEKQLIDRFSCNEILDLLDQIPAGARSVFKMYVIDELAHKEIAEILNIAESTSRAHLKRARHLMKIKIDQLNTIQL